MSDELFRVLDELLDKDVAAAGYDYDRLNEEVQHLMHLETLTHKDRAIVATELIKEAVLASV